MLWNEVSWTDDFALDKGWADQKVATKLLHFVGDAALWLDDFSLVLGTCKTITFIGESRQIDGWMDAFSVPSCPLSFT